MMLSNELFSEFRPTMLEKNLYSVKYIFVYFKICIIAVNSIYYSRLKSKQGFQIFVIQNYYNYCNIIKTSPYPTESIFPMNGI